MSRRQNRIVWLTPADPPSAFPEIATAMREPDGLLAGGGDLSPERVLYAYRKGIFPWFDSGQPILWWSPDPRCVLRPGNYHVSRRFRRELQKSPATVSFNGRFAEVIRACAGPRRSAQGTWITREMMQAFETLHAEGWAHSVEVDIDGRLAGGLYGLAIGKVFFGESMFSRDTNGSKFALLGLCNILAAEGFALLDCQVASQHLFRVGAETIPRAEFAAVLETACRVPEPFAGWPEIPLPVQDFL